MQHPHPRPSLKAIILLSLLLISACSGYEVTVNERTVYAPAPLFMDFTVVDKNLQRCLDQTIEDQRVTEASRLTRLNCTNAGIQTLAGIEIFAGITTLNLADNNLRQVPELTKLAKLTQVDLRNNQLKALPEALNWLKLTYLDVRDNSALQCGDLRQLATDGDLKLWLPAHCH
ncbi:leucine-rich repeat domain-containing protein [Simiduia aestuariiviva]|uniref:Leucine-rich repeat (LRR) protein n=1 Tax=Simiduia aestuariiviva TaxID=1510459 RepID=A0A839UID5_9GAMM|nr:leucine-rich repeat domain-containing protein [Simiduia aestuariiviva]MBB3167824.1 Leucine-rich repeat (LRR) protein [Simiduia aestuariiviva]